MFLFSFDLGSYDNKVESCFSFRKIFLFQIKTYFVRER